MTGLISRRPVYTAMARRWFDIAASQYAKRNDVEGECRTMLLRARSPPRQAIWAMPCPCARG